ncbi:dTDP-4-dehydrorhamnose reductase [Polynucleobacter sp. MG-6-Vaara-E2]|uniref:dTDP-4-dehydrorhamnose reductase n=1 Tax=Polynucleobacter sp. MG-6-Vaara-E2 TaxID=2576932 RepID=UPI001BFE539F|nr:dTDP-4-dehydrorhamnose reductase [Polynucleobacter sp. MG-6-Vaara-E2]QWD96843.1 dTDP-4-dehydrorhamnose reductase [Polynucleobacter sp. MG-6-Vaara-E2]
MNILVFGRDGQLGQALQKQFQSVLFQKGNNILFVGRSECDLGYPSQITNLLEGFKPQLLINAAAYTAVDQAEKEPELAFAINAGAPEVMAVYAAHYGATLLHFSTDYVFDGSKQGAYTESDKISPLGVYGKSKEAGEHAIAKAFKTATEKSGQFAIFRTSWVYGDGRNFIRTILRLAKERSMLRVINDQYGVPTSAAWLAEVVCYLALNTNQLREFHSGIYHAVPRGETSWHALACLAVQAALDDGQELQASLATIAPIPASEYPMAAPRPMNSRLSTTRLQIELERLGLVSKLPHWNTPWDEQVVSYVKHLSKN